MARWLPKAPTTARRSPLGKRSTRPVCAMCVFCCACFCVFLCLLVFAWLFSPFGVCVCVCVGWVFVGIRQAGNLEKYASLCPAESTPKGHPMLDNPCGTGANTRDVAKKGNAQDGSFFGALSRSLTLPRGKFQLHPAEPSCTQLHPAARALGKKRFREVKDDPGLDQGALQPIHLPALDPALWRLLLLFI